jgi:outer membrane protein assembly factor BamB
LSATLTLTAAGCSARATGNPPRDAGPNAEAAAPATDTSAAATVTNPAATPTPSPVAAGATLEASSKTAAAAPAPNAAVGEWPQWRGPNRDGKVSGVAAPKTWPKELKEEWKATVGVGHASPVVSDGKIFVFARQGEEETLMALDPATGKQLWKSGHAVAYEMNPAARGHGKGPKSTPVVSGGKVFTLGIAGALSAHDAKTGKVIWRKDFSKQYPVTSPLYGTSMSPVVEKNLLIAHVGGHDKGALTAFDTETGAVKWTYDAEGPAYSSPVIGSFGGARQVLTFTQTEFVSLSAATGELLWKLPSKTAYDTNMNTPLTYKDTVIFSFEDGGLVAVRPSKQGAKWAAPEVWRNTDGTLSMSTPVLEGNLLFGLTARNKGQLFAVDADTGKTVWQGPGRAGENAAILNLSGTLLVLTNDAKLIVQPANAKGYAPAAEYTVADSPTWAHPVVLGERILVKDETTLRALSLK